MGHSMARIHFFVNLQRPDAIECAKETAVWLKANGHQVAFDPESGPTLNEESVGYEEIAACDLVVTFGGDGTLIRASGHCSESQTPILGVYFGRFGFVTQCEAKDLKVNIQQFLDGQSDYSDRMMLKGELVRNGETVAALHAINEIAVQRSLVHRMTTFSVNIDWVDVTSYPADGILVATPTGSTAYSLSAGGPIVDPNVQAMVLTPITPHSLGARPLVLSPQSRVELTVDMRGDAVLSADGQQRLNMITGDRVVVTRSTRVTRLVMVDRSDFLTKLRIRLMWGARS